MSSASPIHLLRPSWPAPASIGALITTRLGGQSEGAFRWGNLADHVGESPNVVELNRANLARQVGVPRWQWLRQVHGTTVGEPSLIAQGALEADGCYSTHAGLACAVLTADCLPVLMCSRQGDEVAAVHAGWRGLCGGILLNALRKFRCEPEDILIYLGPAIGPKNFEVGEDVRHAYEQSLQTQGVDPLTLQRDLASCFVRRQDRPGKFLADLFQMAKIHCAVYGAVQIYGGEQCTFSDERHFYSYRRSGTTGRFATAIWIKP